MYLGSEETYKNRISRFKKNIFVCETTLFENIVSLRLLYSRVSCVQAIANCRNMRGLGKSMVVFRSFEKLHVRYPNERSTKFESIYQE